nr:chromophore lyase CRL, chloroplastic [Ipomoea batatas]
MCTGSDSGLDPSRRRIRMVGSSPGGGAEDAGLIGGALLVRRFTNFHHPLGPCWDCGSVFSGEKGHSRRTPHKPFRQLSIPLQRFCIVKPCPKEMRCDVEVSTYAIQKMQRSTRTSVIGPKDQRPQPEEVIGFRFTFLHNRTVGSYCTSELAVLKNNEIHSWDRGFDESGNQVWGVKGGPYEFKPAPASSFDDLSALMLSSPSIEKKNRGHVSVKLYAVQKCWKFQIFNSVKCKEMLRKGEGECTRAEVVVRCFLKRSSVIVNVPAASSSCLEATRMENFGAAEVWFGGSKRCTEGEKKEDLRATRCGGGRRPALLPAVGRGGGLGGGWCT